MKVLIAALLLLTSATAFSYEDAFENLPEEVCPGAKTLSHGYEVVCTDAENALEIFRISGKNRESLKKLPSYVEYLDAIELSVLPDADTSMIYSYPSILKNQYGTAIGYIITHGYVNSEMEVKIQLESRFNLKGKLVSVTLEN